MRKVPPVLYHFVEILRYLWYGLTERDDAASFDSDNVCVSVSLPEFGGETGVVVVEGRSRRYDRSSDVGTGCAFL